MASSNSQSQSSRSQIDRNADVSHAFLSKSRRNSTRRRRPSSSKMLLSPTSDNETFESSRKRCREDDHDHSDEGDEIAITSNGKSVTSFLSTHIPQTYNPLADRPIGPMANEPSGDTKYCNRHRPDRKCRRQADEVSMEELQTVCTCLLLSTSSRIDSVYPRAFANDFQSNSALSPSQTNKASPMSGPCSLPLQPSNASSCSREFFPSAVFRSSPSFPLPSGT